MAGPKPGIHPTRKVVNDFYADKLGFVRYTTRTCGSLAMRPTDENAGQNFDR